MKITPLDCLKVANSEIFNTIKSPKTINEQFDIFRDRFEALEHAKDVGANDDELRAIRERVISAAQGLFVEINRQASEQRSARTSDAVVEGDVHTLQG